MEVSSAQDKKPSDDAAKRPAGDQMSIDDGATKEVRDDVYSAALRLVAEHEGVELDPAAERRLLRKIDWSLMPLVGFTASREILRLT